MVEKLDCEKDKKSFGNGLGDKKICINFAVQKHVKVFLIGLWCKGSTTDFDSVCLGSNPSNPTNLASNSEVFCTLI